LAKKSVNRNDNQWGPGAREKSRKCQGRRKKVIQPAQRRGPRTTNPKICSFKSTGQGKNLLGGHQGDDKNEKRSRNSTMGRKKDDKNESWPLRGGKLLPKFTSPGKESKSRITGDVPMEKILNQCLSSPAQRRQDKTTWGWGRVFLVVGGGCGGTDGKRTLTVTKEQRQKNDPQNVKKTQTPDPSRGNLGLRFPGPD